MSFASPAPPPDPSAQSEALMSDATASWIARLPDLRESADANEREAAGDGDVVDPRDYDRDEPALTGLAVALGAVLAAIPAALLWLTFLPWWGGLLVMAVVFTALLRWMLDRAAWVTWLLRDW